ncbi:MAG TPA: c-type cytochrome biogenesis protein CcmI [Saliniramus sp.]|nr:c-type cytochrome biogenesis protein CcmI [Saliniramus sp.]
MSVWILFALMTGAAVMAVLWPLSRARTARSATGREGERRFYEDQLVEIDRDQARGLFTAEEAASAKAEAARRLIRSTATSVAPTNTLDEPALRRRRAASAVTLSTVPLIALAIYGAYGSPGLPAQPLEARLQETRDVAAIDIDEAVVRIETHLAQNPTDGRGWEVLAPVYMREGRFEEAAAAYRSALQHLGEETMRLANYGEALVNAQAGMVSADAREAFEVAVSLDETNPKARFYLAQAAEQDGDTADAVRQYSWLAERASADAPWLGVVRQRISALTGDATGVSAAGPAAAPASSGVDGDAIAGMVSRLDERLRSEGGSAEEWGRLVRSFAVLGQQDRATAALDDARNALASDEAGRAEVEAVAREVGILEDGRP